MPEECIELIPTSEPTVRMKDFVEYMLNNMSEAEQNEAIKVIVETIRNTRNEEILKMGDCINRIQDSIYRLEDTLKNNC